MKSLKLLTLSLVSLLAVSLSSCNKNKSNKDDKSEEEQTSENATSSNPSDSSSEPYIPQPGDIDAANIGPDKSVTIADIVNNHVYTDNYYSGVNESNLMNSLYDLIKGHTILNYNSLEEYMRITDRDWVRSTQIDEQDPYMILIYFTANNDPTKQQHWGQYHSSKNPYYPESQQSWDKEHIWAKSNGIGSSTTLGYSDLHHLRASDMHNNNTRSSLPEADVTSDSKTYVTDFTGANSGIKGKNGTTNVYEPYSIFKGDVARALMYMAVRYKSNLSLTDGTDSSGGKWGFLSNLVKWHLEDPADEFEIKRNSLVQFYQGNRNPFIDRPEYACKIFSGVGNVASVCNSH
ncbi:MAG: endonuclease [Bacilli bacterium]|nr:endonuclease [Bacilli bacterium]